LIWQGGDGIGPNLLASRRGWGLVKKKEIALVCL